MTSGDTAPFEDIWWEAVTATHELSGGLPAHRLTTRVWCALFAPEIEFSDSWEELDLDPGET